MLIRKWMAKAMAIAGWTDWSLEQKFDSMWKLRRGKAKWTGRSCETPWPPGLKKWWH